MSAEDDTFDIDIYGEDTVEQGKSTENGDENQGEGILVDSNEFNADEIALNDPTTAQAVAGNDSTTSTTQPQPLEQQPSQGTKRKAPSADEDDLYEGEADELEQSQPTQQQQQPPNTTPAPTTSTADISRPVDPSATASLRLTSLDWWTTEDDLRSYCSRAGIAESTELFDVRIAEYNQNGKSRGEAYMEFSSAGAAGAVKKEIETQNAKAGKEGGMRKSVVGVTFTGGGNPFRGVAGAGEKVGAAGGAGGGRGGYNNARGGGGYNSYGRGGGFQGRGGYTNQNRGGYGGGQGQGMYNNNNARNQTPQQNGNGGWGMNGNMGGGNAGFNPAAGFAANPMMAGFAGMGGMNMGGMGAGFGMGGRGGGGVMNMMGMGGMNRGGMMGGMNGMGMMGRGGGWGGGFQGQGGGMGYGGGGGSGSMSPQGGNKRQRNE